MLCEDINTSIAKASCIWLTFPNYRIILYALVCTVGENIEAEMTATNLFVGFFITLGCKTQGHFSFNKTLDLYNCFVYYACKGATYDTKSKEQTDKKIWV